MSEKLDRLRKELAQVEAVIKLASEKGACIDDMQALAFALEQEIGALERARSQPDPWHEAKRAITSWQNSPREHCGIYQEVVRYVRHLEADKRQRENSVEKLTGASQQAAATAATLTAANTALGEKIAWQQEWIEALLARPVPPLEPKRVYKTFLTMPAVDPNTAVAWWQSEPYPLAEEQA